MDSEKEHNLALLSVPFHMSFHGVEVFNVFNVGVL